MENVLSQSAAEETVSVRPARVWSAEQQAFFAAIEEGSRSIFLDSKAGTGKTTSLVEAINRVPRGQSVAALSFSRATSDELARRVPQGVIAKGFNGFGYGQLFKKLGRTKVDRDRTRRIAERIVTDRSRLREIWAPVRKLVSLAKGELASTAQEVEDLVWKYQIDVEDKHIPLAVKTTQQILKAAMVADGTVDFDDQVWLVEALNCNVKRFDWVFVDEAQDMNAMQYAMVRRAAGPKGRIVAVGDPRQAIYGFRGAGGSKMVKRFVEENDALHLKLSVTYRCPRGVVAAVNDIVPDYTAHESAPEGDVRDGVAWKDIKAEVEAGAFVLSRTNAPLVRNCLQFVASGKRAMMLGRDFGTRLTAVIETSKQDTVENFLLWLQASEDSEIARAREGRDETKISEMVDRNEALRALCAGMTELQDVRARIEANFSDQPDDKTVVFATVFKAKGLERKSVYVLADTYRKGQSEEEDNMWYVALTRSQYKLTICVGEK